MRVWIHGLVAAFIGAFAGAIPAIIIDPAKFNFTADGWLAVLKVALVTATINIAAYLAKSPLPQDGSTASSSSAQKLGVIALCVLLLSGTMAGCTAAQVQQAEQVVSTYLPNAIEAITQVIAIVQGVEKATSAADTPSSLDKSLTLIQIKATALNTILANYKAGSTPWANVVAGVNALAEAAESTIDLAAIKNPESQAKAKTWITAVQVAVGIIDGAVQATQSQSAVKAEAARRSVKLATLSREWSPQQRLQVVAALYPLTGTRDFDTLQRVESSLGY